MRRLNRMDYLTHSLGAVALSYLIQSLFLIFFVRLTHEWPQSPRYWVGCLAVFVMTLGVLASWYYLLRIQVCRLHDLNSSGWWLLLMFVPFVNIVLFLWLLFRRGDRKVNDYGRPAYHRLSPLLVAALLVLSLGSLGYSESLLRNPKNLMSIEMFLKTFYDRPSTDIEQGRSAATNRSAP